MSGEDAARAADALLDELTTHQAALLELMDRSLTLQSAADQVRDRAGTDIALAGAVDPEPVAPGAVEPGPTGSGSRVATLTAGSGLRTGSLVGLRVPCGLGLGGRVMATGRPTWVVDYPASPAITHEFDAQVGAEQVHGMVAAPVTVDGAVVAVLYGGERRPTRFGDAVLGEVEQLADRTGRALALGTAARSQAEAAVGAERRRMSTALHDSVGALLFGIGAQVRDLRVGGQVDPALGRRLAALEAQVSAAAAALREALAGLAAQHPRQELAATLVRDTTAFTERTGVTARAVALGELPSLDSARTGLLRRVAREGLLNVEKHARATTVLVSLAATAGGVAVAVIDDGRGLGTDGQAQSAWPSCGLGLHTLADQLEQVGGRMVVRENEDGGVTLRAWCPAR